MTESKENLKKRIDTNKNQHIENNEVDNFAKDKNNGDVDLNKLGEYLNNLPLYNNDELKKALNIFFRSDEWMRYDQEIKNKIKNNQPLNKTELSLLYLAMISEPNKHFTSEQLKFDSNKPIEQICNGALMTFIKGKYNHPEYTGKKVDIKLPSEQKKKPVNPLDKIKENKGGEIELPFNIEEIKESEADFYCNRLITRAEQKFPNDIDKAKREIEHNHRYKDDIEKKAYIKRDTLLIAFKKYTETVNKRHEKLITNSGYKDKNDFENQMKLIEEFGKEIQKKYPNIDEIFSIIKNFDEDMKENEKKYFKNENETKKAEKNYKEFNKYMDKKSKEYDIDKIQDSLKKEPKTKEEVEEYLRNMNIIFEFQEDLDKKNKTYGDSIKKYQKFIKGNISIQKKYNIQQYKDTLEKYNQDVSNWSKKIDFKKYENYKNGLDWRIKVGLRNICTLQGIITDPQNEYFPVKEIKDAERQKQIKQDGIDRLRERIKRISPGAYWTLTTLTGLWNGLIDATIGVSTSLGVMILGIIGGRDETLSQMDRKAKRDDFFRIGQSSKQKEAVYSPETGFNFNADNTVSTVASSISQMLTLIYGGGAIGSGATKVFGISESIAGRVGLFTSSFITQVGGSYQEAIKNGLDGKNAIGYSFLSASIQSSLELISPNDVLLGKGSGITKELIRNACNAGGKKGFMLIGKTFLKNVGLDIIKEDIQEGIQTVAGNLINMVVNKIYGSKFETDRSWKNFAATAIITTLTTGITTGVSTGIQMYEMSNQDQTRLIESIKKSNNGLYLEVTGMLDKAIEGKVNIPNVSIQQLQELKLKLTGNNSSETNIPGTNINNPSHHTNTDIIQTNYEITLPKEAERYTQILGSKFHEERRKSRLKSDGTYEPRIEKATDQEWISQHNGQTEVDIANTNFEDLPSNRRYENLEAAKVAIGLIFEKVSKGEKITQKMIEEMSEIVHNKRLERNGTEGSFENQRVPYEQLSEEEKTKDRNQVIRAIETVTNGKSQGEINIPSGKFEAPNEIFAETDESFREIVTKHTEKIKELHQIENMDEFIIQSFEFIKQEMGLNPNIKLKITENDNHYDLKENTVYMSRNRAGHELKHANGKGDKAEIFGGIVHELNHYLQRKELILNFDQNSKYRVGVINFLQKYPQAKENLEYIISHYQDNLGLQEAFEKAKEYGKNRENYIEPEIDENQIVINDNEYRGQPVEAESFRRGDIVVDEYRKVCTNDYFDGKSQKIFNVEDAGGKAIQNSKMMDNLLIEINEQNKSEKLEELRKQISEQYEKSTGEELNLTDEQLLSVLDAHEQDGKLGELTLGQLKQKVKILDETITDPKIRRFLLEAGFCGSRLGSLSFRNKNQNYQYGLNYKEQSNITHRYQINEEVRIPRSDGSSTRARIVSYNPDGTYTANRNEDGYIKGNTFTQREIYDENHLRMNPYELNRFNTYLQLNLKLPGLSQKNNRELGRKLVTQQLIPKNKVDLGNGMYLYTTNKIIGSNSRREYIIGYVIDNSGNIYLRPYYRSMSEGCWRACPGMREEDGNLSKGESISNSSYETTTKIDFNLGNAFDSLDSNYYNDFGQYGKYFEYSPISYIANECNKACFLEDEMGPHNISIWKLFPELVGHDDTGHNRYNATDFYSGMYQHTIKNVIKGYNELVPEGLDYKHMKINPSKGYTYYHKYLGKINVQVCTIKRNGRDLDFHFARAVNSPDKVRIENVTFSDNQLNSWGLYKRQINAGPLVAKPVDYDGQCPNGPEKDQLLPKFINSEYRDIRILYQGNPIIKKFKKISK